MALKQGLPLLAEMETSDLVDFLVHERRSFIADLETQSPALSSAEAKHEIESFDQAVQLVLQDQIESQGGATAKEPPQSSGLNSSSNGQKTDGLEQDLGTRLGWLPEGDLPEETLPEEKIPEQDLNASSNNGFNPDPDPFPDQEIETDGEEYLDLDEYEPVELEREEKPLVADEPVTGSIRELEENYTEDWPDILPDAILPSNQEPNEKPLRPGNTREVGLYSDKREASKPIGGPIGVLIGVMVLAIYILLPLLALTSPLLTRAMAWDELVNMAVATGVIVVVIFFCSILNRHRISYALYAGVVFFAISYGAHSYVPLREFVESEKYVAPYVAEHMREGYFLAAEYSGLPVKTGVIQLSPADQGVSLKQRQAAFDREVEGWLGQ